MTWFVWKLQSYDPLLWHRYETGLEQKAAIWSCWVMRGSCEHAGLCRTAELSGFQKSLKLLLSSRTPSSSFSSFFWKWEKSRQGGKNLHFALNSWNVICVVMISYLVCHVSQSTSALPITFCSNTACPPRCKSAAWVVCLCSLEHNFSVMVLLTRWQLGKFRMPIWFFNDFQSLQMHIWRKSCFKERYSCIWHGGPHFNPSTNITANQEMSSDSALFSEGDLVSPGRVE